MAAKKPMTKTEMIDAIAKATDLTKADVTKTYEALLTIIAKETKKCSAFTVHGLGKFAIVQRKARIGRNPATGEEMKIPAKKALKFTISKLIKNNVLGK